MRILIVSPHFPPRYIGGVEMYTKRLADMLVARGEHPEIVAVEEVDTGRQVEVRTDGSYGYPVHRLAGRVVSDGKSLGASYQSDECERAIGQILDAGAPDVLHLHSGYLLGGPTLAAAGRRRIPVIATLHDYWFICPRITLSHPSGSPCSGPDSPAKCAWCLATEQRRYRVADTISGGRVGRAAVTVLSRPGVAATGLLGVQQLSNRHAALLELLDSARVVLSPSHFLREQMIRAGFPDARICVSRYGLDRRPLQRVRADLGDLLRVGFLGQIAPHKGVHHLVEAVRLLSEPVAVTIHGDLSRERAYVDRVRRLAEGDARITFDGPYVHEQVYDVLARLDVIVVPSVWYENAPFVIQEAQAAGVPVVASRLGGMRELVTDEKDGLLFEPGNAPDLARQLRRLIRDSGLVKRLRPDPAIVRSVDDEFEELHQHYLRLVGAPPPPRSVTARTPIIE